MIGSSFLSLSFIFCSVQSHNYDYYDEYYDTIPIQHGSDYPLPVPMSSPYRQMSAEFHARMDMQRGVEFLIQSRGAVDQIRYLLLDRTCEALKDSKIKKQFVFTRSFVHQRSREMTNCWVVLKRNGEVPKYLWKVDGETKVLVHGYSPRSWEDAEDIIHGQDIFRMGQEYGKANDNHNVFAVDWTSLSTLASYPESAYATRHAGRDVAEYLIKLFRRNPIIPHNDVFFNKLHLIGFSLGAHVSGVTGFQMQEIYNKKPGRITGLDPAGPEFDNRGGGWPDDDTTFLEKSDADFVDVIHCNMGRPSNWATALLTGYFGSWVQAGHADFYPNGGEKQKPYCSVFDDIAACSHRMCVSFFIDSIRRDKYLACKCRSWNDYKSGKCSCQNNGVAGTLMGEGCANTASGRYYLHA